jgi:plasmid stabilization system protein ParE
MSHRVVIEPTAQMGIRAAVRWISENQSHSAATKWFNALLKKVATLKTHPYRCPVAAESDRFPEEIRELLYGKSRKRYRILFTIRDKTVFVLYVHHGARDELRP